MLGKDHVLFFKKDFKIFSSLGSVNLYNSESDPKILYFFAFDIITCNNNVTV